MHGGSAARALVLLRLLIWRNGLVRGTRVDRRRALGSLIGIACMSLAVGWLAWAFFEPLVGTAVGRPDLERTLDLVPGFALFTGFWMLLLSAVTVGIQVFFLSREMPLLLTAPVRQPVIFAAKLAESTVANAGLFLLLGGPAFWSFARARGTLDAVFALQLVLTMVAYAVLPTALGLLVSLVLTRVLPANRTRDLLAALTMAAFAVLYVGISIAIRRVSDPDTALDQFARMDAALVSPIVRTGPWAWAGDALSGSMGSGDAWRMVGALWLLAAAAAWATSLVCAALHSEAWSAAHEAPMRGPRRPVRAGAAPRAETGFTALPGPARAMLLKDLRTLRRDQRQLSMLLIPVAVVAVYLANAASSDAMRALPPPVVLGTAFVLLGPIAMRLAMSAFVTEGHGFTLAMASPARPAALLTGKFLYAYVITLPLAAAATVCYAWLMRMPAGESAFALVLMSVTMAGMCAIGVGSTAFFADFGAAAAAYRVPVAARLVTVGLQIVYTFAVAGLVGVAWWLADRGVAPELLARVASVLLVTALTAALAAGSLGLAARRIAARDW